MMAASYNPNCSVHKDADAKAVCVENKELLCFSCAIDKAKLEAYTVQEIDKISGDKDKLIYEYICMKQIASRKENLIIEYERKVSEIKQNLEHKVQEMYKNLLETLSKLNTNTLHSLECKTDLLLKDVYSSKAELDGVQTTINENLQRLSESKVGNFDSFESKSQLQEVKKKLNDDIADQDLTPEGVFIAKNLLHETMPKPNKVFGDVFMNNIDHYNTVATRDESQFTVADYEKPKGTNAPQPPKITPKSDIVSSDEICEIPTLPTRDAETKTKRESTDKNDNQTEMKTNPFLNMPSTQIELKLPKKAEEVTKHKKENTKKLFKFNLFGGSKPKKKEEKLVDYEDVILASNNPIQVRYLMNTTVHLSGLQSNVNSPCKFSKLVSVGADRIGLLTTRQSTIVVTKLDGKASINKTYPDGVTSIAAMENDQLAILTQRGGTKIETILVTNKVFETKSTMDVKVELSDVTGFDYSKSKSRFALGTRTKHVTVDLKGKIKSTDICVISGSADIATTYDFETECIFVLNMEQKTMKCVSLKGLAHVWRRRIEDQLFRPKSFCLYKDKLCVASSGAITIFAAKDGTPIRTHETVDLVEDCLGICVIDDVLVVSSNSEKSDESSKLAFIGI